MNRRERRAAARGSKPIPASSGASTPAALYEIGCRHMQAGRHLDAQLCCQQALAIDPHHVDTLHLMGLLFLQAKQYDHAIEWIARANEHRIRTDYLLSLGIALAQQGLYQEAFRAFDRAVLLKPEDTELWVHHGNALLKLGRQEDALSSYQRLLKLGPGNWEAAYGCGALLLDLKRPEEALSYLNRSDELRPDNAAVLERRGLALFNLKRLEEALADSRRAHALNPASPDACNNIGTCLQLLSRDEEALPWFDKAIGLRLNFVTALVNKAFTLIQLQRFNEAITVFNHAKAIDPDDADLKLQLSLLHLLTGNFEAGWAGREARWQARIRPGSYPQFSQPIWLGDGDIEGKTILVLEDEGLGDTIQFARYVPMLAARGARVVLRVGDAVYPLLAGLSGVSQCIPKSVQALPAFDLHCPICSLPLAFGTRLDTIPSGTSYLPRPAEARVRAWENRLQDHPGSRRKLRVGLVWSGNPNHVNDHNRSIPLRMFLRLLESDATFISVQKDPRPDDKTVLEQSDMVDLTWHLTDFAETAALVSCLDLVITVDTGVAHLAGALGRPTWILLPYTPDYRWLLDRDDSPWYPTARLFRQTATREWGGVLDRVRRELAARISLSD